MQESTESKPASESPSPVFPDATQGLVDASSFVTDTNLHQQKVAKRIQELENEIRALKSCHNASTVTCRIPIEVLSKIFHYLAFSEPEPWLRGTENSNSYRWIQVTHVCRHWRSSAIDSTALWRHLNFEEPSKLVGTMLERSKGAPVDVVWRHHKIRSNTDSPIISFPQANRIRSLKIACSHAGDLDTLLEILGLSQLTGCASVLEELEFEISQTFSTFSLPETLFSGGTPILSRLRVHGVKVGLNRLLFSPSLTTLRLRGKAHTPLTTSSLLETFGQMRNLQTLQLDGFLDFSPSVTRNLQTTGVPLFTFPSLLNMGVHGHPKDVNYFLQLTRCNTAVSVEVDLLVPQEPLVDDSRQAVSNILSWWGYSSPETKLNVRHFNLAADLLGLELDFDPETVEHPGASSPRGKNRLVISSTRISPLRQSLNNLQTYFNFQTLTSVSSGAVHFAYWRPEAWRFFAGLPAVNSISLCSPDSEEIRSLLEILQEYPGPLGINHTITFPCLSLIHISGSSFHDSEDSSMTFGQFVAAFTAIARRRHLFLCPVPELQIMMSEGVGAVDIALLRESNPGLTVVWDGDRCAR